MKVGRRRRYEQRWDRYVSHCEAIGGMAGDRTFWGDLSLLEALRWDRLEKREARAFANHSDQMHALSLSLLAEAQRHAGRVGLLVDGSVLV